jgi:hypothetical protein
MHTLQPMKKQIPPAPTPRAAALSQSASRFSAGATSAWQNIAGNSLRLAAASRRLLPGAARVAAPLSPPPGTSRVALEPQRLAEQVAPAAAPETIRQVGWREEDRAVGMSTKRKYSLFGVGFGPKVPVFETKKVKLPVYQETDREKRYYTVADATNATRVRREGLHPASASFGKRATPRSMEQFNAQGSLQFFASEAAARRYAQESGMVDYIIIPFVIPEYQIFTPDITALAVADKAPGFSPAAMHTTQVVGPEFIR